MLRQTLKILLLAICFTVVWSDANAQVTPPGGCIPVVHRNWQGCQPAPGAIIPFCVIDARTNQQTTMQLTQEGYDTLIRIGSIRPCTAPPSCTQGTEQRTLSCPAGQTGLITEQRATNVGGVCGVFGQWLVISNTCTATCTEGTETRTSTPCPSGQAGVITERRTTNTGGVCGVFGAWTVISNTCQPVCTETTETRTSTPCPSGYTGVITERRTLNVGGVCNVNSGWTQISNTCQPQTCPLPWGGSILVGQSVVAYQATQSQPGQQCVSQIRTCQLVQGQPVLSGSYIYQNCTPVCTETTETRLVDSCPAGQSGYVTERRTVNIGGVCGQNSNWAEISRTCTPIVCNLPWGGTIGVGQTVTAYQSSAAVQCVSQTRTCTAVNGVGVLTGTYTYQNCTPICLQQTETRTSTQCPAGQTGVITEQRTVNVGGVCGQYGNWTVISNTCQPTPQEKVILLAKPKTVSGGQVTQWDFYPYCTDHYAAIGMEFNPNLPYKIDVVLITGSSDGRLGKNCGGTGNTGRLKFAEIPLVNVTTGNTFTVTAKFYAKVNGCNYVGPLNDGYAERTVVLNVDKSHFSTSYVNFVYDPNGQILTGQQAATAVVTQIPCVPYADFNGLVTPFAVCPANGAQTPGYMIWGDRYVTIN